jgi:ferredoxin
MTSLCSVWSVVIAGVCIVCGVCIQTSGVYLLTYESISFLEGHKACTKVVYCCLSWDAFFASGYDKWIFFSSESTPAPGPCWPTHLHFRSLMVLEAGFFHRSILEIHSGHHMCKICLRQELTKTCSLCFRFLIGVVCLVYSQCRSLSSCPECIQCMFRANLAKCV